MRRYILKLIPVFVFFLINSFPVVASQLSDSKNSDIVAMGTCGDSANWTLETDGCLTIKGKGAIDNSDEYLKYKDNIEKLIIEEGITEIGTAAFKDCKNLGNDISLPESLKSLHSGAFSGCNSIKAIVFNNSKTYIAPLAKEKTIPENALIVGHYSSTASNYADSNGYEFKHIYTVIYENNNIYTGKSITPKVVVKNYFGKVMKEGVDYNLNYPDESIKPGHYYIMISYTNEQQNHFQVEYGEEYFIYPKRPSSFEARLSGGHDDVKISWKKSPGADGYNLYYKKSDKKNYSYIKSTSSTNYVIKNLSDNTLYDFKIIPYFVENGKKYISTLNYSSASLMTTKNIKAPSSIKTVLFGYDDVKVSWTKSKNAVGYYVYYKKATDLSYNYFTNTKKLSVKLNNLSDGVKYTIKIVPYYKHNSKKIKSYYSKTATIYTMKKLPVPSIKKSSSTKVNVSWTNIYGESGYQISKSTNKTGTDIVSTYSTTSGKSKTISATEGKVYYYKVRAYKTVDGKKIYAPWSSVKSFKL